MNATSSICPLPSAIEPRAALVASIEGDILLGSRYYASSYRVDCADDLAQAARIAAFKATRTWRPDGGASFRTYARRIIGHAMRDLARQLCNVVHIPRLKFATVTIACVSLDTPVGDADGPDDTETIGNRFLAEDTDTEADSLLRELLTQKLAQLNPRQRQVIVGRFYEGKTLQQVGTEMNVTRERIRQIEEEVLTRWRQSRDFQRATIFGED